MEESRKNVFTTIIVIIMFSILFLIIVYRKSIFNVDESEYGTLITSNISDCVVPNLSFEESKCTDVGNQYTFTYCRRNPSTGFFCLNNGQQDSSSRIRSNQCIPNCQTRIWNNINITPCLILDKELDNKRQFVDPISNWCNKPDVTSVRFRSLTCKTKDGSGPNTCTHLCNDRVSNPSCELNNTVLTYNSTLSTNIGDDKTLVKNGNLYTYTPISNTISGTSTVASDTMVLSENCFDLKGNTCGNWESVVLKPSILFSDKCNVSFNNKTSVLRQSDLYINGYITEDLNCVYNSNDEYKYCDVEDNCINNTETKIIRELKRNSSERTNICGEFLYENGKIVDIDQPKKEILNCLYFNSNLSLDIKNFDTYEDKSDTFNPIKSIISTPLYMTDNDGFLSIYNSPCAEFDVERIGDEFEYSFTDSFLSFTLDGGIPKRFNCTGNVSTQLESTPCSWTFYDEINNLPNDCTNRFIREQNALVLLFRPLYLNSLGINVYNILAIHNNSFIGWLSHRSANDFPGYIFDSNNPSVSGPDIEILVWNQGKFDFIEESPGVNSEDLGDSSLFRVQKDDNGLFFIQTSSGKQISTIGDEDIFKPLKSLNLNVATIGGKSIMYSTSKDKVEIDEKLISDLLYSRQFPRLNNTSGNIFPECDIFS